MEFGTRRGRLSKPTISDVFGKSLDRRRRAYGEGREEPDIMATTS